MSVTQWAVEVKNLSKIYKVGNEKVVALNNVSLQIAKGEICCIFGQSGSGKSTLLNLLAGLERPSHGAVRIHNSVITRLDEEQLALFRQKHIGFVFQSYNLLPNLTALENVAMPLLFQGVSREIREKQAAGILKSVGLAQRMQHYPRQMSGGQQQRVGIARAFINRPDVIFADEPTGNLDSKATLEIMDMIQNLSRKLKMTIILVTHNPDMIPYADHTVTLLDGAIVQETRKAVQSRQGETL